MLTPTIIGVLLSVLIVIVVLMSAIRILPEYERGVVFRLGSFPARHAYEPTSSRSNGLAETGVDSSCHGLDPRCSRCRDTVPAAFHYFSTTEEDCRGLQGTHGDNEFQPNPFSLFDLTTKVARRRHFSKRAA